MTTRAQHMRCRRSIRWPAQVCGAVLFAMLAGCWNVDFPQGAEVTLPEGNTVVAPQLSGSASLANTRWAAYRTQDGSFIARMEFGPAGEVLRIYDNAFYLPELLGSEVVPDGQVRPAAFLGGMYAATVYGGENDSGFGFAAHARAWVFVVEMATGRAYAYGVRDGDLLVGTFGYATELVGLEVWPFDVPLADEYEFYALRE